MEPILYLLYITWKIFTMQKSYNFAEAEDEAYFLTRGMKKKLRFIVTLQYLFLLTS
jgi:hypothetical protein